MEWHNELSAVDEIVDTHSACENAFFKRLRGDALNQRQLGTFGSDYLYWISSFPGILAGLIATTSDARFQFFLTEILFSELGSGDPERMHFRLFARLLGKLGVTLADTHSGPRFVETRALVEGMRQLYRDEDILHAMGAQYALERQAFPMIEKLYVGFKHYSELTRDDCEYFELHLVEEPEHLRCMQECMKRCIARPEDIERVKAGAVACLDLIAAFWRRMYEEVTALEAGVS